MRRMKLKQWITGAVLTIMVLSLVGCGRDVQKAEAVRDDSLQKILDAEQLVLGLDDSFPPMGFVDAAGEIVGFDIDVAQEACDRLGVRLVKQGINWDSKEEYLNSRRIDCIWNGLSVTPGRADSMSLSDPYMKNELIIVVPGASDVMTLRDLKGRTVGVQSGSTAQEALEASELYPEITMTTYDTVEILVNRLNGKEVDAALIDSVAAYYFIFSSDEQYFILSGSLGEEEYAIGFRKDDVALRDKIQELINEMKADGTLGKISRKWFGSDITIIR